MKTLYEKLLDLIAESDLTEHGYYVPQPSTFTTVTTTFRTRTKINNRIKCKPRYIRNR